MSDFQISYDGDTMSVSLKPFDPEVHGIYLGFDRSTKGTFKVLFDYHGESEYPEYDEDEDETYWEIDEFSYSEEFEFQTKEEIERFLDGIKITHVWSEVKESIFDFFGI